MKYLIILVVLLAVAGGGWVAMSKVKAMNASAVVPPPTDQVTRRTVEKIVSANGKVASNRDVDIKCQASGNIKVLPYTDVSKEVKPGEMVCQLDPIDEQRLLETAQAVVDADNARLTEAQINRDIANMALDTTKQRNDAALASGQAQATDAHAKAERTRQLYEAKPTALASKEELDTAVTTAAQADATVENAKAAIAELEQAKIEVSAKEQQIKEMQAALAQDESRVKTAKQDVDYCTVTAPEADNPADPPRWFISALLTNIAPGYLVQSGTSGFSAGTTIMTLSDLSHIFVLASVQESDVGLVSDPDQGGIKQKVRVTADSFRNEVFEGEVVRVARKGVNTNNVVTFEVKIEVTSNNRILLRPEMTVTANIVCASKPDVLSIPATAFSQGSAPVSDPPKPAGDAAATAPATLASATTTGPTSRRGRGSKGGAGSRPAGGDTLPGVVTVVADSGASEQRNIVVGLLGADPLDPGAGDLYEVVSGLTEGEYVVTSKGGSDSKFRQPSAQQAIRSLGGGGRGR